MSSESSKDNCEVGKIVLFYDDFKCEYKPDQARSPYVYFSAGNLLPAANDAAGGVKVDCGLTINSTPFTYTNPTGLDHVKYLIYQRDPYNAPRKGAEIVYEGIISVEQTGLDELPIILQATGGSIIGVNNVNSDIRIACGALNCFDPETFLVTDFILSNEDIYAFYELLPFNRTDFGGKGPNYQGFSHAIPVGKRNVNDPGNDFVKLAIAYNYKENYVRWLINDIEVYRVNRLGLPIERKYRILDHTIVGQIADPAPLIRPKQFQYGFGTFSLMDMYNPQNPGQIDNAGLVDLTLGGLLPAVNPIITNVNGTTIAPTFLSGYPIAGATGTNFGQGAILKIKYLTVYIQAQDKEIRCFDGLYCCKSKIILSRCRQDRIPGVNSSNDLICYNCKGKIDDCDDCESNIEKCDCIFSDHKDLCRHEKSSHKCKNYKPHTKKCKC